MKNVVHKLHEYGYIAIVIRMCELRTYLASYSTKGYKCSISRDSQYIGNYSTKNSSTCVDMKLKALLVVRRIVSWEILHMDKCVYVVHSFYMCVDACTRIYTSGLMSHVFFAFAHVAHTRVLFKLWVICTIQLLPWYLHLQLHQSHFIQ